VEVTGRRRVCGGDWEEKLRYGGFLFVNVLQDFSLLLLNIHAGFHTGFSAWGGGKLLTKLLNT